MNMYIVTDMVGFAAGIYVGFSNEDELHDLCRQGQRTKRKAVRKMHKAYDTMCDCMDLD